MSFSRRLLCVLSLLLLASVPLNAQTPPASLPASPPNLTASAEILAAKQALQAARQAETLTALDASLTRASAAQYGFAAYVVLAQFSAIWLIQDQMSSKPADKASHKSFAQDVTDLQKRYRLTQEVNEKIVKTDTVPPDLRSQGHLFFQSMIVLTAQIAKQNRLKSIVSKDELPLSAPERYTYQVLSPISVRMTPLDKGKLVLEARWENGQCRLDLGRALRTTDTTFGIAGGLFYTNTAPPGMPSRTITPKAAALLDAISDGKVAVVKRMLHADPSLANFPTAFYYGHTGEISDTPMAQAIFYGNPAIVQLIISAGADTNRVDDAGETPLYQATHYRRLPIIRLLLQHGAKINRQNGQADMQGKLPLQAAVEAISDIHTTTFLIAHGAKVNAQDNDGQTALFDAVSASSDTCIKLLLKKGANINAADNIGQTPLYWAVAVNQLNTVKLLLAHGAKVNARAHDKKTPLDVALDKHYSTLADFLRQHGGRQ